MRRIQDGLTARKYNDNFPILCNIERGELRSSGDRKANIRTSIENAESILSRHIPLLYVAVTDHIKKRTNGVQVVIVIYFDAMNLSSRGTEMRERRTRVMQGTKRSQPCNNKQCSTNTASPQKGIIASLYIVENIPSLPEKVYEFVCTKERELPSNARMSISDLGRCSIM